MKDDENVNAGDAGDSSSADSVADSVADVADVANVADVADVVVRWCCCMLLFLQHGSVLSILFKMYGIFQIFRRSTEIRTFIPRLRDCHDKNLKTTHLTDSFVASYPCYR